VVGEQPGQGDLRSRGAVASRDRGEQVDEGAVSDAGLLGEPGQGTAQIALGEGGRAVDGAGEEALAERAEPYEADAQLEQGRQNRGLGFPPP
jgi:hypothetical protein